MHTLHLTPQKK
ncbi:hypothetical protein ACS0PU_004228 [Formica fusca]